MLRSSPGLLYDQQSTDMGGMMQIDLHKIWAQNVADRILDNLKAKKLLSSLTDMRKVRHEVVETLVSEAKNLPPE